MKTAGGPVLVTVATFNEAENLPYLAERLAGVPVAHDVLIIDDNSPDGTGRVAEGMAVRYPSWRVLHRRERQGLGPALREAYEWGLLREYDWLVNLDGDLSHDPAEIPRMLETAQNADAVIGSRYTGAPSVADWTLRRLLLSLCACRCVRFASGMPYQDPTSGFRLFNRKALEVVAGGSRRARGFCFHVECLHKLWRSGLTIAELPIVYHGRKRGCSKMSCSIVGEGVLLCIRLFGGNLMRRVSATPRRWEWNGAGSHQHSVRRGKVLARGPAAADPNGLAG